MSFEIPTQDSSTIDLDDNSCYYSVWVSYAEIYNEFIYDLLGDAHVTGKTRSALKLQDDKNHNQFIRGELVYCTWLAELQKLIFSSVSLNRVLGSSTLSLQVHSLSDPSLPPKNCLPILSLYPLIQLLTASDIILSTCRSTWDSSEHCGGSHAPTALGVASSQSSGHSAQLQLVKKPRCVHCQVNQGGQPGQAGQCPGEQVSEGVNKATVITKWGKVQYTHAMGSL